jgi:hypothetical protein
MPSLRDRRLGWGEKELRIVYSPAPTYKDFVPLVRGTAKKGPHALARIPLRIALLYDADQYSITTSPEATATVYNSQSWDVTSTDQQQIFQAVLVNRRWRWWVDHAPDILFLIIGIFLGDWLATKESSGS